jgi:hypothetical protein
MQPTVQTADVTTQIGYILLTWSRGNKNGDRYKGTIHFNVLYFFDGKYLKMLEIPLQPFVQ